MFMYEVFKVVGSTAPINNKCKTKLLKVANVIANNSLEACNKAEKHYKLDDVLTLAHMKAKIVGKDININK